MTEQQWEFCQLHLYSWEEKRGKWYYELRIFYFGEGGDYFTLSTKEGKNARAWSYNPWVTAMSRLGSYGWELVNVQHGTAGSDMYGRGGLIVSNNCVAYFKRPAKPGRPVTEPKLVLD